MVSGPACHSREGELRTPHLKVIPFVPFVSLLQVAERPFSDTSIPDCGESPIDCIGVTVGSAAELLQRVER
jgi:hypothetical protein